MLKNERRELKTLINDKLAEIDRFVGSDDVKVENANIAINPEGLAKARELYREVGEMKAVLDMASVGTKMKQHYDLDPDSDSIALQTTGAVSGEAKTLGEWFTDSEEYKQVIRSKNANMASPFELAVKDVAGGGLLQERKDVYATMNTIPTVRQLGSIQFDPMVPRAYRKTRVRDLFPVATTSSNLIDYFQVVGYASALQGAKMVPDRNSDNTDFASKPHTNLVFRPNQAPVRTIAHWEMAHRNVMDDVPQLQSTINNELLYGLRLEEDRQILQGNPDPSGDSPEDLQGILTVSGTQAYNAPVEEEIGSDSLRRAMTKAVLAYYEPTGFVLHPNDFERIELQKGTTANGGDGQYMLVNNIAVGASQTVWRLPVVETPAMPEGTFLTGAFGTGVQIYDRQQANVRTSEHHGETFVKNAITILVESRLAIAHKRPESMVVGTLHLPTS